MIVKLNEAVEPERDAAEVRAVQGRSERTRTKSWWKAYATLPALLWLALVASINTGPWALREIPSSLTGWIHFLRAAVPPAVLLLAVAGVAIARRTGPTPRWPRLWIAYALIGLVSGYSAPDPMSAAYWIAVYLAAIAALELYLRKGEPVAQLVQLNYLTWFATAAILVILVIVARDVLADQVAGGHSGYGAYNQMREVGDMAMSRSSGMARFGAVPAIVALVAAFCSRGFRRAAWLIVAVLSCALIYFLQSRGAIFAVAFAIPLTMFVLRSRARVAAILLVSGTSFAFAADLVPHSLVEYVLRGQDEEEFKSMTGRTRDWQTAIEYIGESPLVGWGAQSDRWLIGQHVHNTYLYAALQSGIPGALLFTAGLAWAWLAAVRVYASGIADRLGQRAVFAQCLGILAFFTVRSIPEVSGAMFGVDLMVMLPAMAYLTVLASLRSPSPHSAAF